MKITVFLAVLLAPVLLCAQNRFAGPSFLKNYRSFKSNHTLKPLNASVEYYNNFFGTDPYDFGSVNYQYNADGRLIKETWRDGDNLVQTELRYSYDSQGRLTQDHLYRRSTSSNSLELESGTNYVYKNDSLGRIKEIKKTEFVTNQYTRWERVAYTYLSDTLKIEAFKQNYGEEEKPENLLIYGGSNFPNPGYNYCFNIRANPDGNFIDTTISRNIEWIWFDINNYFFSNSLALKADYTSINKEFRLQTDINGPLSWTTTNYSVTDGHPIYRTIMEMNQDSLIIYSADESSYDVNSGQFMIAWENQDDWIFYNDKPLKRTLSSATYSQGQMHDKEETVFYYSSWTGTGVDESGAETLIAGPNPCRDYLKVNGSEHGDRVSILDPLGRLVYKGTIEQEGSIDLRNLPDGMYSLRVETSSKMATFRFLKIH